MRAAMLSLRPDALTAGLAAALALAPPGVAGQSREGKPPPVQPVPQPSVRPPVVYAPRSEAPPALQRESIFEPQEITKIPSEKQKYCRQQHNCKMTGPCKPCDGI